MTRITTAIFSTLAAALIAAPAIAQQTQNSPQAQGSGVPARPANTTTNLPSDTGSQTTLPSGAVTGAGQPQGTTRQPDRGSPGGLETRARAADRATTTRDERRTSAGSTGTPGSAGAGTAAGASGSGATAADGTTRRRPAREPRG